MADRSRGLGKTKMTLRWSVRRDCVSPPTSEAYAELVWLLDGLITTAEKPNYVVHPSNDVRNSQESDAEDEGREHDSDGRGQID